MLIWEQKCQLHIVNGRYIPMPNVNELFNLLVYLPCLRHFDFVQSSRVIGSLHSFIFKITDNGLYRTRIF